MWQLGFDLRDDGVAKCGAVAHAMVAIEQDLGKMADRTSTDGPHRIAIVSVAPAAAATAAAVVSQRAGAAAQMEAHQAGSVRAEAGQADPYRAGAPRGV